MKKIISLVLIAVLALCCAAFAEEDGQQNVIELIGDYADEVGQRASMHIETAGENEADVTIYWANSATETVEWHFTGLCADDLSVSYDNCVKTVITADEESTSEEIIYENGTGMLLCDPETYALTWQDDVEDAGKDCLFVYAVADNTFAAAGLWMGASEEDLRATLGEPAGEETVADRKTLVYEGVAVEGIDTEARFMFADDALQVMRFTVDDGNSDTANDLTLWLDAVSGETDAALDEETVKSYATTYCGITDFDALTYFTRYALDGTLLIYLRTSETDINVLCLDHVAQF